MIRIFFCLLCIGLLSVFVYADQEVWIEQELAGDDAPLNESYSYSPEEEESTIYNILEAMREVVPEKFFGEFIMRTRHNELTEGSVDTSDYWYERFSSKAIWEQKKARFGALSLRRFGDPGLSARSFAKYQIRKKWVELNSFLGSDTIILGNFRVQYGQGLVFYGSVLEFSRPFMVKSSGLKVERGTNPNAYFNGCAWENTRGNFSYALFFSRAWLSGDLNDNGTVDENMYDLKNDYGLLETEAQRMRWRSFYEDLAGFRSSLNLNNFHVGLSGYEAYYNKTINPTNTTERYSHVFRGDRNTVMGVDGRYEKEEISISGEYAVSKSRGDTARLQEGAAWIVTPMMKLKPWKLFVTVYDYNPEFYNRHAKGASFSNSDPNNQKGFLYGIRYKQKPHTLLVTYRSARTRVSEWTGSGRSSSPRFPADMNEIYAEYGIKVMRSIELAARIWNDARDRYVDIDPSDTSLVSQTSMIRKRLRGQITWTPSKKARYKIRYENRVEKIPVKGERLSGDLIYGEILYKPSGNWQIGFRQTIFDSDNTYISQYEPVWNTIYQSQSFYSQEGIRSYIIIRYNTKKHVSVWTRYGRTEFSDTTVRDDFRLQTTIRF